MTLSLFNKFHEYSRPGKQKPLSMTFLGLSRWQEPWVYTHFLWLANLLDISTCHVQGVTVNLPQGECGLLTQ